LQLFRAGEGESGDTAENRRISQVVFVVGSLSVGFQVQNPVPIPETRRARR